MTALRVNGAGPGGIAEAAEETEPGDGPWSHTQMLLAQLVDAVHENTWAVIQSRTEETIPKRDPIPRPGVRKTPARQHKDADPRLVEWLTRRQNGEDTAVLDAELGMENVTPLRPYTGPGGDDGGY